MFAERRKTLLLALVACVQLVLAPALRPAHCGRDGLAPTGGDGCCAVRAPVAAEPDSCCCGDERDDADGSGSGQDRDRRDGCHCVHAPQPWAPGDDGPAIPTDPAAARLPTPGAFVAMPPPSPVRVAARVGPPGCSGVALHVLHCVFLI